MSVDWDARSLRCYWNDMMRNWQKKEISPIYATKGYAEQPPKPLCGEVEYSRRVYKTRNEEGRKVNLLLLIKQIKRIRTFRGLTQRELGLKLGYEERNAYVRIAQYDGYRVPKTTL